MKIARLASFALAGLSVCVALSCNKNKEEEKPAPEVSNAKFKVALNLVESNRAEVIVRHDGKDSDTWFGFITEDLTTSVEDLIKEQLVNVSKSTLHVGAVQTVESNNLKEYTKYRYIAFGVTAEKETFGTPGSLIFTTDPNLQAVFAVSVENVTVSTATVNMQVEGEPYLTYYYAISSDATATAAEIAADGYNEIVKNGALKEGVTLFSGASSSAEVTGLTADTQYRAVVYGVIVDNDGVAVSYGTPAEVSFSTLVDYDNVKFAATVSTVGKAAATFDVTYDTNSELTWYAFVTENMDASAASLIAEVLPTATEANIKAGKMAYTAEGLEALTTYRFIVTGVKDGAAFGTPADVKFKTADEDYDTISFTAEFVEADKTTATFNVKNSSANDNLKWTYVVSTDMTASAASLLPAATSVAAEDIYTGHDKNFTATGLTGGTAYRLVVAGYREDSEGKYIYGTPADIKFSTASAYSINAAWTFQFNGKKYASNWGRWALYFGVHNTNSKVDIKVYTKAEFDAAVIVDPLIKAASEEGKAKLAAGDDDIDDLTWEDNASETQSWLIDAKMTPGEYVAIIYDVDDEFTPKGSYQQVSYSIEESQASAAYNKWLGKWNNNGDIWEITADVPGESFNVSGILGTEDEDGKLLVVKAGFNPGDGTLNLYHQISGYFENSNYGTCSIDLVGWFVYTDGKSYYLTGNTRIASASIQADGTVTVSPGNASNYGTYKEMSFYWVILEGENAGRGNNYSSTKISLPTTLQPLSNTGSEQYNAWLGTWSVPRGSATDTWVISQDVANVSYKVTGVEGLEGRSFVAKFDSSTGKISVANQQALYSYSYGGDSVVDKLMGMIEYGSGYSRVSGGYTIFTGSLNGNTAALQGGSVTVGDGNEYPLIGMMVFAFDASDGTTYLGSYLEEGDVFTGFPNTITKVSSSTSSVKLSTDKVARKVGGHAVRLNAPKVLSRGKAQVKTESAF